MELTMWISELSTVFEGKLLPSANDMRDKCEMSKIYYWENEGEHSKLVLWLPRLVQSQRFCLMFHAGGFVKYTVIARKRY